MVSQVRAATRWMPSHAAISAALLVEVCANVDTGRHWFDGIESSVAPSAS